MNINNATLTNAIDIPCHRHRRQPLCLLLITWGIAMTPLLAVAGTTYEVTLLTHPVGTTLKKGEAISPNGRWIVGETGNKATPFVWNLDTGISLLSLSGYDELKIKSVSSDGTIVGEAKNKTLQKEDGFYKLPGQPIAFFPSSNGNPVKKAEHHNGNGQVLVEDTTKNGVIYNFASNSFTSLGTPTGSNLSNVTELKAKRISDNGIVVGEIKARFTDTPVGEALDTRAFLWNQGVFTMITAPTSNGFETKAATVNNLGWVAGEYKTHANQKKAFFFNGTSTFDLLSPADATEVKVAAINDAGMLVGHIKTSSSQYAFAINALTWEWINLQDQIDASLGLQLREAKGITEDQKILINARDAGSVDRVVILSPIAIPEPVSLSLLAGLAGLVLRRNQS